MIPLHDHNPTARAAVVTVVLIVLNIGVYFALQPRQHEPEVVVGDGVEAQIPADVSFSYEWAAIPCEILERRPLGIRELEATLNGDDAEACAPSEAAAGPALFPDKREWIAVVVSMFLHGGVFHLGSNMLFLWVFGNNVEDRLGRLGYLAFYLAGGVVATVAHVLANAASTVPVVGASGAVAAVMGAYLVWFPEVRIHTFVIALFVFFTEIRAKWLLGFWFALQFLTSPDSGVAWVAHVAGFAFGVLAGLLIGPGPRTGRRPALGHPDWAA